MKTTNPFDQILTVSDAAAIVGVSTKRINQLYDQRRIEGRKIGRDVLLLRASVEAFAKIERSNRPLEK